MKRIVILGGGPTGLTTAYELARHGVSVQVIERFPWTGGLCKTFQHSDLRLDLGPHRFTPHTQEVLDLVRNLCGEDLRLVPERIRFYLFDRMVHYPFKLRDLLDLPLWLPAYLSATMLYDGLRGQVLRALGRGDRNYEDWAYARFGRGLTNLLLRPLVEKTWGLPLSQFSWRLARQRIAWSSGWRVVWASLTGGRRKEYISALYPEGTFYYPRWGYGTITDRLTEWIRELGGWVTVSSPVTRVVIKDGRVACVYYSQDSVEKCAEGDYFVSTIPINLFFTILEDEARPRELEEARRAAGRLKFRKLVLLYLVLKKEQVYHGNVAYFPGRQFSFGRTWQQREFSPDMIPQGIGVLGLELTCWEEDTLWQSDDKSIFELVFPQLERIGLVHRSEVKEYFTVRLGYAYPVWDVAYRDNLAMIARYVASIENLLLIGRPGFFFYNNIHHSLEMGLQAARHILSGKCKAEWERVVQAWDEYRLIE